jgi:hypothetical protein
MRNRFSINHSILLGYPTGFDADVKVNEDVYEVQGVN